ncbi:uncharacterized protein BDR25DRAFT_33708 [Lindgomyces ingoldianus]|uniref:Uncharacterized protein n=1 Tax=Lindgomyces ingoldianus TaxID=673940 RepID=A0ACB6QVT3_9PLEO|nr:uncharacterized protein BDR25DRAFT_33708 [Lindgomyces ingoldianus]KAF2470301.1 hypothetical protein BDR25DRAFT_33708 [Lindgomyces ingoldianus]
MVDYNTTSRGDLRDSSRPATPTGPTRTNKANGKMRALNTRPTQQETFFDDSTPVDNSKGGDKEHDPSRDSHDLSFGDGTRDSVVDNMLLSLDQLPTGASSFTDPATLYSNFDDDDFFLTDNPYPPPRPSRLRGHTYTSSHSSDYDLHPDDTSSRYSSHHSRGRRSNSSNNIQHALSRKESLRGGYPVPREKQANGLFGEFQTASHSRGGGKKGSKGSGSSSMDFGYSQALGTQRIGFGNRSASFDHGNMADRSRISPVKTESILDRSRPAYQTYNEYDAAPQPTIPAGPRRAQQAPPESPPAYPPQPSYAPPQAPAPRRKSSVRSSRTLRKNKSQPEPNMRLQAQEFVNASKLRDLPPIPSLQGPPAPSPTVATRKHLQPNSPTPVTTPKEKPGFFRRVFGGSSRNSQPQLSSTSINSNPSHHEASPASHRTIDSYPTDSQTRPRTTPSSTNHIASQLKSLPRVPQTASSAPREPPQPVQPSLAKKHSSFFRRRKKSVSESTKPPVMAIEFKPPKPDLLPAQPSPGVSSLRKVMNPYLGDLAGPAETYYDSREHQSTGEGLTNGEHPNGFSPGYKPHKDATVRTIKPGSRGTDNTPPSSRDAQVKKMQSLSTDSPKLKLKMKHGRTSMANPQDDSFLADSSSCNDDGSTCATPSGPDESRTGKASSGENKKRADLLSPQTADSSSSKTKATAGAASASQSASDLEDDGWVVTSPTKKEQTSLRKSKNKSKRVWLEPTSSEEKLDDAEADKMSLPLEGARTSQQSFQKASPTSAQATTPSSASDVFHSATSLPVVQVESRESEVMPAIIERRPSQDAAPTDADRGRALQIFSGDEDSISKAQAAAILGDFTPSSLRLRRAFFELFNWSGFNILMAMRDLCGKLVLKAETQQVDRILMSLSERWCQCNPNHGFKATDVVHTICYSVLLLNTDLHLADIETRMTRSQFVKNTLPTLVRVCKEAVKEAADETLRPQSTQMRRGSIPWTDKSEPNSPAADATVFPADVSEEPLEGRRARSRLSVKPPIRNGSESLLTPDSATAECNALVNNPYNGPMKGWEYQVETVLKEFYNQIRQQRLPLHGASTLQTHEQPSSNSLSVSGMLRRTPSVLSKAPSDSISYRGRSQGDFRSVGARWTSKTRSRPRLYPASTVASSRTSLDDQSVWSPAGSSTWSRYSFGKTQTSMSMESLGSHFAHGDYQQAIGFANALSQAIIREEGMPIASNEEFTRVAPLLEDETLELAGAPWAKEGILKHKHHLEALDKKAKDRTWNECFAVIEKGYMRLFSFSMNSKSLRNKNKPRPSAGSVVGGGNWMDNAEALDSFLLRQSIASALPPPGYSKSRPHVWALSLPTGAVHLFQVGTPDIVREFVSTANYWSARLSKEPLMGGVSNVEYGWGENVVNPALIRQDNSSSTHGHVPRPSMASSIRSSVDHATGTVKPRLPGDKVGLSDWSPPTQSMMASNLMEVDQLKALTNYVKNVEEELSRHNELRAPMLIAFSPRHPNAARAMSNWERKSSYLLREIVKFRTYIDSLNAAQAHKDKIYAEREAEASKNTDGTGDSTQPEPLGLELDGGLEAPKSSDPITITA